MTEVLDDVVVLDACDARLLPLADGSVEAVVTSPPYNLDVDYADVSDRVSWGDYEDFAAGVASEIERVLVDHGRAWVNVQRNVGEELGKDSRKRGSEIGRIDLAAIWSDALGRAGLRYRNTVVWVQDSHDGGTAWGSYRRPSAPNLRGDHEVVLVYYKGDSWARKPPSGFEHWEDDGPDWESICRNVWKMTPAPRNGHPAPYPPELAARCIRLSTWPAETVLDPFAGSGSTGFAARKLGRRAILSDASPTYVKAMRRRFTQAVLL